MPDDPRAIPAQDTDTTDENTWDAGLPDETKAKVRAYVESRLRGQGGRLKELEARLGNEAGAASQAAELTAAVGAYAESVASRLPEAARGLVPRDLPPAKLLAWIGANGRILDAAASGGRGVVEVHAGGGRTLGPVDAVSAARETMRAAYDTPHPRPGHIQRRGRR